MEAHHARAGTGGIQLQHGRHSGLDEGHARGAKTLLSYNGRHLPTAVTYDLTGLVAGQNVAPTPGVTYQYDAAGNRTQMMTGQLSAGNLLSTVNYAYDSLSRLTSETIQFNGLTLSFTLAYGRSSNSEDREKANGEH